MIATTLVMIIMFEVAVAQAKWLSNWVWYPSEKWSEAYVHDCDERAGGQGKEYGDGSWAEEYGSSDQKNDNLTVPSLL